MFGKKAGKLLEASLVTPISIATPGFALVYSKMWRSFLIFSGPLILSGYYAYSNAGNDIISLAGISIFLSVHLLSLTYVIVCKTKDHQ